MSVVRTVVRKSEAAPLSENAEQNSNYLRLNAQCELRKWEEFRKSALKNGKRSAKKVPTVPSARPLPVVLRDRVLERGGFQCS